MMTEELKEKHCSMCGVVIDGEAGVCPACGVEIAAENTKSASVEAPKKPNTPSVPGVFDFS